MKNGKITENAGLGHAELLLLLTVFIWGMNPTIVKLALREISLYAFNTARYIVAVVTGWIYLLIVEENWKVEKEDLMNILVIGCIGNFVYQGFYIHGISATTAGNASMIFATLPIIVALINGIFKLEKISPMIGAGIFTSFIGIVLIITGRGQRVSLMDRYFVGNMMILLGTFAWAVYTILNKRYLQKYSPLKLSIYGVTVGLVLMLLLWSKPLMLQNWADVSSAGFLAILYSGVFSITLASVFWNFGISKVGSTKTSLFNNITPIISVVCGFIILDERLQWFQGFGGILIFTGLLLTRESKNRLSIQEKQ